MRSLYLPNARRLRIREGVAHALSRSLNLPLYDQIDLQFALLEKIASARRRNQYARLRVGLALRALPRRH